MVVGPETLNGVRSLRRYVFVCCKGRPLLWLVIAQKSKLRLTQEVTGLQKRHFGFNETLWLMATGRATREPPTVGTIDSRLISGLLSVFHCLIGSTLNMAMQGTAQKEDESLSRY